MQLSLNAGEITGIIIKSHTTLDGVIAECYLGQWAPSTWSIVTCHKQNTQESTHFCDNWSNKFTIVLFTRPRFCEKNTLYRLVFQTGQIVYRWRSLHRLPIWISFLPAIYAPKLAATADTIRFAIAIAKHPKLNIIASQKHENLNNQARKVLTYAIN